MLLHPQVAALTCIQACYLVYVAVASPLESRLMMAAELAANACETGILVIAMILLQTSGGCCGVVVHMWIMYIDCHLSIWCGSQRNLGCCILTAPLQACSFLGMNMLSPLK